MSQHFYDCNLFDKPSPKLNAIEQHYILSYIGLRFFGYHYFPSL